MKKIINNFSLLLIKFFFRLAGNGKQAFFYAFNSINPSDILGEFYENWPFYDVLTLMGVLSSAIVWEKLIYGSCCTIKLGRIVCYWFFSSHRSYTGAVWTTLSQEEEEVWILFGITWNMPFRFGQKLHNQATRH